ncbi:branched-chain amino acid ABC transporter permease [Notoacmeibacter ruber]|uniref:Branched-chain amino acid ABC transporter permease n=1 Tax=Notoacmeibacter ruber TaxID=2670375 RepID=A0A3L7JDJ3_9HYPH|nr:branched-chain amino acid ABC transporter permease [Notoacmeibacter ruber]RLQ88540.1 branched-chain amino acid ABC transporter permease [Notoacmeibacter ruber]
MVHVPNPRPTGDFRVSYAADRTIFRTRNETMAVMVGLALVALAPLFFGGYVLSQLILIGIYGIAALGLNVLTGMTGQISLGHGAFFGFGAFASAWIASRGIPVLIAIPLAGVMTMAVGMIFGIPAARLKGLYLAIATLASQYILEDFFARADWFTGGTYGSLAETASLFGFQFNSDARYLYLVLFWVIVTFIGVANLSRTRDGRALVAVRDHYLSAEIMGINLTKYRILSFGISSFFAGIGGALYGHYLGFVSAEGFTILLSIEFLAMIIIGGLGSVSGSLLGAAFILLLPQAMEVFANALATVVPAIAQGTAYIKQMSVGAAIILFLVLEPEGLVHRWRMMRASWKLYPFSH